MHVRATRLLPLFLLLVFPLLACQDPAQGDGTKGGQTTDVTAADDSIADPSTTTDTNPNPNPDTAPETVPGTETETGTVPDTETETDTAPDTETVTDTETETDAAPETDTETGTDTALPTQPPCGIHQFTYKPKPATKKVVVTGNWVGWLPKAGTELLDSTGNGTFTAKITLGAGSWQYKFIVDGTWLADPNNPAQVDDGFGGKNSLLVIAPCPPPIDLVSATANHEKGAIQATFKAGNGTLNAKKVSVTIDWQPYPAGCVASPVGGNIGGCKIAIKSLAKGIHDVRVSYQGHTVLLKVYSGISTDWRAAPIYFAMTDRFENGNKANDKPVGGLPKSLDWQGGDFAGLKKRIDDGYFSDLGIGALWISWPARQFAGAEPGGQIDGKGCGINPKTAKYTDTKYTAYHGYWPVSLDEVEPRFGTLKELQQMVVAAHNNGIRVLLDFTANHVHIAAPLFAKHKDDGWFHLPAEVCGDIGWDKKPISCWFTKYLADFNYSNPATRNAVIDSAERWVKRSGADGFRLDAVKHIEMPFVEELRARMDASFAQTGVDFYIVGETFTGDAQAIKVFVSDTRIHAQFDFPTNMQVLKTFAKQEMGLAAMDKIVRGIKGVYGKHSQLMCTFLGNHDMARFFSFANGDIGCGIWDIVSNQAQSWQNPPSKSPPTSDTAYRKLLLAFTYIYSAPGIPLIYYGDEIGLPGAGDPDNRRFMPTKAKLVGHQKDLLAAMKVLGKLREKLAPLRVGDWPQPLLAGVDLHIAARTVGQGADRQAVVVAINRGTAQVNGSVDLTKIGVTKLKTGDACQATVIDKTGAASTCKIGANMALSYDLPARTAVIYAIN